MKVFAKLGLHGEYYGYVCLQGLYKTVETAIAETMAKYADIPNIKVLAYTHDHMNFKYDKEPKHTHVVVYNSDYDEVTPEQFASLCDTCCEEDINYWELFIIEENEVK